MTRTITAVEHVTLDGVMQAPGHADEDERGEFRHGGWAVSDTNDTVQQAMGTRMTGETELLFGRRTFDDLASAWPETADDPFSRALRRYRKYVVSRSRTTPVDWANSTLLAGDAVESVTALKEQPGPDLVIMGSGDLLRSLGAAGLVDEYLLFVHPLVLGSGNRLFPDGTPPTHLELAECTPTVTGVIVTSYRPRHDGGGHA